VIMVPRCFRSSLDPTRRIDRAYDRVRRHAPVFYALLLGVVLLFEARNHVSPATFSTTFLVHLFDGIFFVHYFVEAFLWKFNRPYFRQTLAPLYFPQEGAEAAGPAYGPTRANWAAMGLLVGALFVAWSQGLMGESADRLRRRIIDPMYAQDQMHWGLTYARRGDWNAADRHLRAAVDRNPDNQRARLALEAVVHNAARSGAGAQ